MTPEHDRICYLCGKPGGNPAAWSLGELGGRGKFAHAGCVARHQRRLAVELQLGACGCRLRRHELRSGLGNGGFLRSDLVADARDSRFLGRHLFARRVNRQAVIAVIDRGDDVAGMHIGVVGHRDAGEIAWDLGGERRVVGLHVGVVGRHRKTADCPPAKAEPAGGPGGHRRHQGKGKQTAAAPLRRSLAADRRRIGGDIGLGFMSSGLAVGGVFCAPLSTATSGDSVLSCPSPL